MKKYNLLGIIIFGLLFSACDQPNVPIDDNSSVDTTTTILSADTIIIGTGNEDPRGICTSGPGKVMVLVKFYNQGQENKVIVQHPIKEWDGIEGKYVYCENSGLYFNNITDGLHLTDISYVDSVLHLAGTSPYIPLTNGYFLIDWKWQQFMPLWACSDSWENAYHNPYAEHICNHIFMTDVHWTDLTDITTKYETSKYTQHIKGIELVRVDYYTLDAIYNDVKENDPYVCYNYSLYCDGLSILNMGMYLKYGDCASIGRTYLTYIAYCDSLQDVYQQRLIEIINNGKLKEVGF